MGVGERIARQGLNHHGIELGFSGAQCIDFAELTGGKSITIYAQHEVTGIDCGAVGVLWSAAF